MIHASTPHAGAARAHAPDSAQAPGPKPRTGADAPAAASEATESLDDTATRRLAKSLAAEPEIRAEKVARARQLVADPNYPPLAIIERLAQQMTRDAQIDAKRDRE